MTYRERFRATLAHRPVDRVPFDLSGTPHTDIENPRITERLRQILGLHNNHIENSRASWYNRFDEGILEYLDIDFRRVGDLLSPESELISSVPGVKSTDCWGVTRINTGLYWDIVDPPLKGATLHDLDNYPWPKAERIDPAVFKQYREQAQWLFKQTDYVICAEHPMYGVFELGCWMCGFDDFLMRLALEPDFVLKFFDIILDYQKKMIALYYEAVGPFIHVTTSGDDFGMQTQAFMSRNMFDDLVKPYLKERIRYTKQFTDAFFFQNTCGSVYELIPSLIDAGVDILNPIQPGAKNMEPERLKQAFGDKLTFWGGIDTQHLLPSGTKEEVLNGTAQVLSILSKNGGYVLAPAHNIQRDVPPENILAIYEAGKRFKY